MKNRPDHSADFRQKSFREIKTIVKNAQGGNNGNRDCSCPVSEWELGLDIHGYCCRQGQSPQRKFAHPPPAVIEVSANMEYLTKYTDGQTNQAEIHIPFFQIYLSEIVWKP